MENTDQDTLNPSKDTSMKDSEKHDSLIDNQQTEPSKNEGPYQSNPYLEHDNLVKSRDDVSASQRKKGGALESSKYL